ncbi:MAG: transposase [Chlamydiota bacterium]|nr:transposase [Chlamydiota bacterium]
MPRDKRLNIPGGVYHVISRGIERRDIFLDGIDKTEFLSRLENALVKTDSQCLAWVLMGNHFHLLIRTGTKSLSELMRKLLTGYAIYFNKKHKRHGYLYQNRYKSVLCQEDVYLLELVRYIHLNPVRAGIISTIEELDVYPWSGIAS